jgi:hypothetical protein
MVTSRDWQFFYELAPQFMFIVIRTSLWARHFLGHVEYPLTVLPLSSSRLHRRSCKSSKKRKRIATVDLASKEFSFEFKFSFSNLLSMEPLSLVPSEISNLFTKVSMLLGSSTYSMFYMHLRLRHCLLFQ